VYVPDSSSHIVFWNLTAAGSHLDLVNTPIYNIKLHYGSEFVLCSLRLGVQVYWVFEENNNRQTQTHTNHSFTCASAPCDARILTLFFSLVHLSPRLLSHSFTRALSHAVTLASSLIHTCTFTRCDTHILTLIHRLTLLLCFPHAVTLQTPTQHNTTTFLKCGIS